MGSVGVARLEREYDLVVEWVPYELHPEIPPEGVARERALPTAYRARAEESMRQLGEQVGLSLVAHDRLINSRPALQAAEYARAKGHYRALHGELFRAYWDEGKDISDMTVLREVAGRAGIDVEGMQAAIKADQYGDYLDARRAEAEELMISGIPAHVIDDRYLVMGAQPYAVFERVLARVGAIRQA